MFAEHPDIEAVVLASANSRHMEQVRFCAERGIHILSMKIPTFDLKEYDEMIELCDKAGIICQVELEMHYNPVVLRLKKLLAEGAIGKTGRKTTISTSSAGTSALWRNPPKRCTSCRKPTAGR